MTVIDVARWMLDELERRGGWLQESDAVAFIAPTFGSEFVSCAAGGARSVNRVVVDAFLQLGGGTVRGGTVRGGTVRWDPERRAWHFSEPSDAGERLV